MTGAGEAIWQSVSPLLPGFTVEILPEIASTNSELMRRARAGRTEPVLLVAEKQTAGRGRLGRTWASAPGESLTFSLGVMLRPASWSGLSLAIGVALAETLHPRIRIKWPNDLWLDGRKLAGILIETATSTTSVQEARYTVIGVGMNIARPRAEGLSTAPAGLVELTPACNAADVLVSIARPLVEAVQAFETFGFEPFHVRFDALDALRDRGVVLSDGTVGTAHGTNLDAGLLVHTAAGMVAVTSAEVSVRPAP